MGQPQSRRSDGLRNVFRRPDLLCLVLLAPLLFLAIFHIQILDPTNVGWLIGTDGDWAQHALGWHAFQHSPWGWPPAHHDLLSWPTGVSVLYTDSNPLLSLSLKGVRGILPDDFQFTGLWFLGCIALQVRFGFLLLRTHAPGPWSAVLGTALLCMLPALYQGIDHDTLVAHFTILWALWIFLEVRSPGRKGVWYAVMLGTTALIHPYLLIMNTAIFASDVAWCGWRRLRAAQWAALSRLAAGAIAILVVPITMTFLAGFDRGRPSEDFGFGFASMGLDAPFNPQFDEYSLLVPSVPADLGQSAEGFQYMGLGILLAILGAGLLLLLAVATRRRTMDLKPFFPLMPALLIMLGVAVSNVVQVYDVTLFVVPLPHRIIDALGIVRASGRLFWPLAYVLILIAIRTLYALPGRRAVVVLAVACLIQIVDLVPFALSQHQATARAVVKDTYPRVENPAWDDLIRQSRLVVFQPDVFRDLPVFYQVSWRAVIQSIPVNTMYVSRPSPAQDRIEAATGAAFQAGRLNADVLYVALDPCMVPDSLEDRARWLDGVVIFPAAGSGADLPPAPRPPRVAWGQTIRFSETATPACILGEGWSSPATGAPWSLGDRSLLTLRLARPATSDVVLTLTLMADHEPRPVTILVNDREIARLVLAPNAQTVRVVVPAMVATLDPTHLHLAVAIDDALDLTTSGDRKDRRFERFRLDSLRIDPTG